MTLAPGTREMKCTNRNPDDQMFSILMHCESCKKMLILVSYKLPMPPSCQIDVIQYNKAFYKQIFFQKWWNWTLSLLSSKINTFHQMEILFLPSDSQLSLKHWVKISSSCIGKRYMSKVLNITGNLYVKSLKLLGLWYLY